MAGLWGAAPSPLPTSLQLLHQMGCLLLPGAALPGRVRQDDCRQAWLGPHLTHSSPPFRWSLSSCPGLTLGCWTCEMRWEVRVCDIEQKLPSVLHSSPPQTQIDRQMDRHTQINVPIGPHPRMLIGSSLTNACACACLLMHTHTQSECWWGICMCVGAGKGARPPADRLTLPQLPLGPCLPSPVSTLPDAKGYLLQPVPIHYEGPLNQQGHFWGCPRGGPLGAGAQPCTPRLVLLSRETLGCVRLKVRAGNKKIGVNYYSPHGFPKESGSSSLRPVFLFDGESDKWQAACSDKALLWAQPLSLKPSYYA